MNDRHTTDYADAGPAPAHLRNKSAREIVAYLQEHFSVDRDNEPQNKSTAYLQAVAEAVFDPDWKNPFYARMPKIPREWIKATVIWYHGAEAGETFAGVYSQGYACG